jgi:hypothetical protein
VQSGPSGYISLNLFPEEGAMGIKYSNALRYIADRAWMLILQDHSRRSIKHFSRRDELITVFLCAGAAALFISALMCYLGDDSGKWTGCFFTTHEDAFSFFSSLGGLLQ